jgi:hypothetical protein
MKELFSGLRWLRLLICWTAFLLSWAASERWVSTLSGDYLMLDSRCSTRETDELSGLRIGVLRQVAADTPLGQPNLMILLGGGGHTREAYEDVAARVFERLLPDCIDAGRAPRMPLTPQHSRSDVPRPDLSPRPCATERPWVVVGAAAAPGQSFATAEGCAHLVQLARSLQARWNTTKPVHLTGVSAGGMPRSSVLCNTATCSHQRRLLLVFWIALIWTARQGSAPEHERRQHSAASLGGRNRGSVLRGSTARRRTRGCRPPRQAGENLRWRQGQFVPRTRTGAIWAQWHSNVAERLWR